MTIREIEELTYDKALELALETMEIKEHQCVFADLQGNFGYSILVFKDGKPIYFANDYELHHPDMTKENLRDFYISSMNKKLYMDDELMEEINSYDEYTKKEYFLRNYWIMRHDYVTIFGIGEEAKRAFEEAKKKFPFYNPVSFCYVADQKIVETQEKLFFKLKEQYKKLKNSNETFREMIRYELANHEACITCDYREALRSLGLTFETLSAERQQQRQRKRKQRKEQKIQL